MNRRRLVITLIALIALLLTTGGAIGQGPDSEGEAHPQGDVSVTGVVNSRISYQGRLLEDGTLLTDSRDMIFRLFSDGLCTVQVGSDIIKNGVMVTDGLFSVELDVTHSHFNGQGLWLEVEVGGTAMGCQEILPVPYALSLRPGAVIHSDSGVGVHAISNSDTALWAETSGGPAGVDARNTSGTGVYAASDSGIGVHASSDSGTGVYAASESGVGVHSISISNTAVWAVSSGGVAGVDARNTSGTGMYARSESGVGVHSISISNTAVWAETTGGVAGVDARNTGGGHGVYAESAGPGSGGAALYAKANDADGIAIWGNSDSTDATLVLRNDGTGDLIRGFSHGDWAYRFRVENDGRTTVSVLAITGGSDLSEQFDVTAAEGEVTPGLVVCIDANHPGKLLVCNGAYDRTVAGVVSGAGGIEPGMVMGQQGSPADGAYPVALTGRVYVWADASAGPIQPGDLLTTSDTPGHVMKVRDYAQAQGAIIGKAMSSLDQGQGLILVLVSLQ
jgi:hypothetical protein